MPRGDAGRTAGYAVEGAQARAELGELGHAEQVIPGAASVVGARLALAGDGVDSSGA